MEFYSAIKGSRPIRCSEQTRQFAWDSLHAKYGRMTYDSPAVDCDDIENFAALGGYDRYDVMINLIAKNAPLRLCENELIVGSATLGEAIGHRIPCRYKGEIVSGGISHLTLGFDRVLREGLDSYVSRIRARLAASCTGEQERLLESMLSCVDSLRLWHSRYMDMLNGKYAEAKTDAEREYFDDLRDNLAPVPFKAPRSFRQGVQALWFLFAFTRLCGYWSGIGRIDYMLGGLLDRDLADGKITIDEARELIAHFFIKGCEWIRLDSRGTGDAQHYQNIVLAGSDGEGHETANIVTRLVLEVVEEFPISDYPIAVRINSDSPEWLVRKISEVMKHGSGVCAIYNERMIMKSLVDFGYSANEVWKFANDGCWEVQIPGKTVFGYQPMDADALLQREVFGLFDDEPRDYGSFDELAAAYDDAIARLMESWHRGADGFAHGGPCASLLALMEDDCIENSADYYSGGTRYRVLSPHLGGVPDAANELYAVKKLVFEEKKLSFPEFMTILKNNWKDAEELRLYVRRAYKYYGNDNDECDEILVHIMDTFMSETRKVKKRNDVLRPPGISTFGRQIDWKDSRKAHAHGFFTGDILASNLSPTPTTDTAGATAIIMSHCKVHLENLTCGTALDIKLDPTSVKGADGVAAITALINGFVALGGFFLQIDVMDNAVLLEAQKHPENYQNLSVRISGWSARFVTLCDDWQRMIIERT